MPPPGTEGEARPIVTPLRLSVADRVAFVVLALGLVALGGVLLAAGLALLVAIGAGGALVATGIVLRNRLFGHHRSRLAPGEVPASGSVLPPPAEQQASLPRKGTRAD
jgi:hypothetical protein